MTVARPRILDLTDDALAYATRLLVDLGADVIRIEPPGGGRRDESAEYFHAGKRSVALDLRGEHGHEVFARLCGSADVVVEGITPAFDRVETIHARLLEANPHLSWVAVREFAPGAAPMAKGSEIVRYALSGLMSITGDPQGAPMLVGGGLSNAIVAAYAAVASHLGMLSARAGGRGRLIWVSAHEALLTVMQQGLLEAAFSGKIVKRAGSRHAHIAMAGALPCQDGHFVISANERRMWRALVEMVGDEQLADESLNDERERMRRQAEIFEILTRWAQGFEKAEISRSAQTRHIPVAPVHNMLDVVNDPQLRERAFFRPVGDDSAMPVLAAPWAHPAQPAPRPGEHTEEILHEVGFTLHEIEGLERHGIVARMGARV
jgi:CoA:oxalate CoA-transferase